MYTVKHRKISIKSAVFKDHMLMWKILIVLQTALIALLRLITILEGLMSSTGPHMGFMEIFVVIDLSLALAVFLVDFRD